MTVALHYPQNAILALSKERLGASIYFFFYPDSEFAQHKAFCRNMIPSYYSVGFMTTCIFQDLREVPGDVYEFTIPSG